MSMSRTSIKCNCGHRIGQREVMQTGYYPRVLGPSLVSVRFRCSRCKKLGEQFVKQEDWDNGILKDTTVETSSDEKTQLETLGRIGLQEQAEFHKQLDGLGSLAAFNDEFGKSSTGDANEKQAN